MELDLKDEAGHVHDGAQANEPAWTEEEGITSGVRWKFVAGFHGHGSEFQQLGETHRVSSESDQRYICGIHRERGRVGAADGGEPVSDVPEGRMCARSRLFEHNLV